MISFRVHANDVTSKLKYSKKNSFFDIAFKCNYKCANFKKTRIFEQSRSLIEGKWRDRMKNNADVTRVS